MERQKFLLFSFCFFLFSILAGNQCVQGSPTKLFVFGDSYADTGNDNISEAGSWKVPYGVTFPGKPAGRFSDGRILTDCLAKFLGLKSPIPYSLRKYAPNRLQYGINFAYGGSGVFKTLVSYPNMTTQIDFFQNLIRNDSLYNQSDLQSSLALVTNAGNDYSAYLANGGSLLDLPSFIIRVVNQLASNLKRIQGMGVRKLAVAGLQPLGCLPRSTVANSFQQCNVTENLLVMFHNLLLQEAVAKLNNESTDRAFVILDLYGSFMTVLENKGYYLGSLLKFETPLKPCCMGTSSNYSCGNVDDRGEKMYTVCADPESAFFWDTFHPTQAGWNAVYSALNFTV